MYTLSLMYNLYETDCARETLGLEYRCPASSGAPQSPRFPLPAAAARESNLPSVALRIGCNRVTCTYLFSRTAATAARTRTARRESVERFSRHHAREEKSELYIHIHAGAVYGAMRARGRSCRWFSGVWMEFINVRLRRLSRYGAIRRDATRVLALHPAVDCLIT